MDYANTLKKGQHLALRVKTLPLIQTCLAQSYKNVIYTLLSAEDVKSTI